MIDASEDSVEMCKIWRDKFHDCSKKLNLFQNKIQEWREYLANPSTILTDFVKVQYLLKEIEKLAT